MLFAVDQRIQSFLNVSKVAESAHEFDKFARLQKDQSAIAVVIRQGAKGFVTQRDLRTQPPIRGDVKGFGCREGHDLIDPAESVDGNFFDEQLVRYSEHLSGLFVNKCV